MNLKTTFFAATTAIAMGGAATAATIEVELYNTDPLNTSTDTYIDALDNPVTQDFENIEGVNGNTQLGGILNTNVGSFETLGGTGTGGSAVGDGTELSVKNSNGFGRQNTTTGGEYWLDSNDTFGIRWIASLANNTKFTQLAFSLSDAVDQGATLTVAAAGDFITADLDLSDQNNGTLQWVVVSFENAVEMATISLTNSKLNDGFGIDDTTIAAVPLPAGILLLGTALGGLGVVRRRTAKKADA